jgi:hypothetical protein
LRVIKLMRGCIDCQYGQDADGLQFDHVGSTKVFNVSQFSARSVGEVCNEIAKCEVRCGTCHAIRSARENRKRNKQAALDDSDNDLRTLVANRIGETGIPDLLQALSAQNVVRLSFGGDILTQLIREARAEPARRARLVAALES